MNIFKSTKRTSVIFLPIVLVTGTITALLSPSFMTIGTAQAQPYYGMNSDRNSYESNSYDSTDYSIDKDRKAYGTDSYKPKYPSYYKDDRDKSQKDIVSLNKINCINPNINANGDITGDINLGNNDRVATAEEDDRTEGYWDANSFGNSEGYYNDGYNNNKKDKGFDCIIKNNNINNIVASAGSNQTITGNQTDSLTVNKEVYSCIDAGGSINCQLQNNDPNWFLCTDPLISNRFDCQGLPGSIFDIEVLDDQNNQIQQFEGSIQGTTIQNLQPGTYTVNEIKVPSLPEITDVLEANIDTRNGCINSGFDDGGVLFNSIAGISYRNICIEYEDEQGNDCSTIALAAGEEKTCTVKNYIRDAEQ